MRGSQPAISLGFQDLPRTTARYMIDLGFNGRVLTMHALGLPLVAGALIAVAAASAAQAGTIDDVRARGVLNCGVNEGLPGFSAADRGVV